MSNVGYFRLSAYFPPLQNEKDEFKDFASFERLVHLYEFDRALRLLFLDPIERIEVQLRTKIVHHLSHKYDPFVIEKKKLFLKDFAHGKFLKIINNKLYNSDENFIEHFKKKYTKHKFPPIWMISEILSFGQLSLLYSKLNKRDKQEIAKITKAGSVI